MATYQDLLSEYKKLAKRADQRLVRLEKAAELPGYKTATKWAYHRAKHDIEAWAGHKVAKPRFNVAPPKNKQQLQAKIADIKTFLEAPTSTKSGITSVYKARAKTINETYGTKFTWQDMANYYQSGVAQKMSEAFGSDTALQTVAQVQKNKKKIIKDIEAAKQTNIVVDNEMIQATVNKLLADNGLTTELLQVL